ncbi:MAG: hypothetical protein G3M70_15905 [Candidatus Nitronauta litoralis]|uniref:Uncharacterized protein n=1 Tax=Candidatus Nitronauta litoralis TaxID=2705533 RepID=A0A7T0BYH6_9BACT|nr:MAG: hypothetical protein G3M70_15905 [Candidatus Nitronauta litoralis]
MDILTGLSFSIPFNYVLLITGIMALALIWGKRKLGLLAVAGIFILWAIETHSVGVVKFVQESSIGMLAALSIVLSMSVLVFMVFKDQRN